MFRWFFTFMLVKFYGVVTCYDTGMYERREFTTTSKSTYERILCIVYLGHPFTFLDIFYFFIFSFFRAFEFPVKWNDNNAVIYSGWTRGDDYDWKDRPAVFTLSIVNILHYSAIFCALFLFAVVSFPCFLLFNQPEWFLHSPSKEDSSLVIHPDEHFSPSDYLWFIFFPFYFFIVSINNTKLRGFVWH